MQELKRFPTLKNEIATAANDSLERFRDESRKTVTRLVDMESSYLTVEKLGGNFRNPSPVLTTLKIQNSLIIHLF
jgi:hypothetical protein